LPPVVFAFFSILLIWRFIGHWKKHWLPNKILVLLLTICGMAILFTQHHTIFGRDAGTSLFITALGLKLMEIRKPKDIILIIYLAFIVAASQLLYRQNIFMAVYIFLVCILLFGTLILINNPRQHLLSTFKQSSIILLQALPFMMVMFIFFPRLEAPRWMFLNDSHAAQIGLGNTLEPGSISRLGQSDELVFRVRFSGAVPSPDQRYWRGPVFSHTDGKRWSQIKAGENQTEKTKPEFSGTPYVYTLLLEPQKQNWIFALDLPAKYPAQTIQNANYQLLVSKTPQNRAEYQITSYTSYNTGPINQKEIIDNLQLPGQPSKKLTELVVNLQGSSNNPRQLIKNTLDYFSNSDFYYTLRPPLMPDKPIEAFLFEHRRGFCSHYATAFVYLMRIAKIPARVVTGYQGGKYNDVGNFLEIRQANAHAWAEVWLDQRGWIRIDPTAAVAPERIEQDVNIDMQIAYGEVNFQRNQNENILGKWLKRTGLLWNSIDYHWQRWIINYTTSNQKHLLQLLGIQRLEILGYLLVGIFSVLTSFLIFIMFYKKNTPDDMVLSIYHQFCSKIATKGVILATGDGAKDFSHRCKQKLPYLGSQIDAITSLYLQIRYGKSNTADKVDQLKSLVASFKA
jgi:transglutaminase-like putative cysteine protease